MQPLKSLTNVPKARLLHSLLINEIPEFLGYLNELREAVLNDKEGIVAKWNDSISQLRRLALWQLFREGILFTGDSF